MVLPESSPQNRLVGALYIVLSATGFGAMAIFAKLAYASGVGVATLLFLRFALGGLALAGLMVWRRLAWPRGRDLLILVAMGAVGYFGQAWCYFTALQHASAGLVALLLYLYPALVAFLAALSGRQRLGRRRLLAVLGSFVGLALTLGHGMAGSAVGIGLGMGAAAIYAVYILVGEGVTARRGAVPSSTVIMLAAALTYGALMAREGVAWPGTPAGWWAVAGIALLSTVVAMIGFFAGMQRLGAADAATLSTLEPVVTLLLAAVFLGEDVGLMQALGGGVILASVVVLARSGRSV